MQNKSLAARLVIPGLLLFALAATNGIGAEQQSNNVPSRARMAEAVRHELAMLPYFSVFDNLQFQIRGMDTVVLKGQVTRPILKKDAERAVEHLERAGKVVNQIEVLPVSPNDDRIRVAQYRAIYSKPGLDRYGMQANPPIHIVVKNGNVTLEGVVASESDRNLAFIAANGVPGVFSVKNNLRVENRKS